MVGWIVGSDVLCLTCAPDHDAASHHLPGLEPEQLTDRFPLSVDLHCRVCGRLVLARRTS